MDQPPSTQVSYSDIPRGAKVGYGVVALVGFLGLVACLGRRLMIIRRENPHNTPFIRWLVICIYIVGILFVSSSTILQYGFELNASPYCKTAILLCLVFYLSAKVLMYFFLVERARLMRLPLVKRKHDSLWLMNMAMVVIGFGTIAVLAFVYLVSNVSPVDGQCRIGLQLGITIALLAFDMFINMWLTGLFISLAAKYIKRLFPEWVPHTWKVISRRQYPKADTTPVSIDSRDPSLLAVDASGDLAKLARKTLAGSIIMMSSTVVNLAVLLKFHGEEAGWVCLLICTIDIIVGVFTIHWVTSNPKQKT